MFFRLGAVNAWRNLARSVLAIASMAVAAAFLTYTISLSRGYSHEAYSVFRQVLGGEAIAYASKIQGEMPQDDAFWEFNRPTEEPFTDLDVFHPEIFTQGYLNSSQTVNFKSEDLVEMAQASGVSSVSPYYRLPAFTLLSEQFRVETPIRGRDFSEEYRLNSLQDLIYSGRYFEEGDQGQNVAIISRMMDLPQGMAAPEPGSVFYLEFPTFKLDKNQDIRIDYINTIRREFKVIGNFVAPTREFSWQGEMDTQTERLYWWNNEIQIPLSTWQEIWQESAGDLAYPVSQVLVQADDLTYLEDTVLNLVKEFSDYSFVSVPNQALMAMQRQLIEKFITVPTQVVEASEHKATQQGMAMDLRLPIMGLVLLNAALLVAANMLIMINERKREMAILKSVGAKRLDITIMALTEALILALFGALIGFLVFRLPGALNQFTNGQKFLTVMTSVGEDLIKVLLATGIVSLIFGLVPALKMAGMSVMTVLRNE